MDIILTLYEDIKKIRIYLIKLGPQRRTEKVNLIKNKLKEVAVIYKQYENWLIDFNNAVKNKYYKKEDILLIENYCHLFLELHKDIILLCDCAQSEAVSEMSSFDLKTALNLLPVMTNEVENTKQLIDNIEYYDCILKDNACKQNLIKFVLKSRLSQEAKLMLKLNYGSVNDLIIDMKNVLLSKKSATAIQNKLQTIRQNEASIEDYGREITKLFVDLTISQADGNEQCYNILKPHNEKIAIKRFADGLRNRRLSTIMSARNYSSLKDAVQAAQDEETSTAATTGEILGMYKKPFNHLNQSRGRSSTYRGQRGGRGRPFRGQPRNQGYTNYYNTRGTWSRGRADGYRQQRGNFRFNNTKYQGPRSHNFYTINESAQSTETEPQVSSSNQFFRDQ